MSDPIDFRAGDPGNNGAMDETNFRAQGGNEGAGEGAGDQTVVLELGGRKFTKADLEKKIVHADQHIDKLTAELHEQRELLKRLEPVLAKQVSAAEVLAKLQQNGVKKEDEVPSNEPPGEQPAQPAGVNPEDIASKVLQHIEAGQQAKQQEENWRQVTSALTAMYGEAVNSKVKEVCDALEMTPAEAVQMAKTRPKAFLKLFDAGAKQPVGSNIGKGALNAASFKADQKKPSGYVGARSTKDQVSAYLQRLEALQGAS